LAACLIRWLLLAWGWNDFPTPIPTLPDVDTMEEFSLAEKFFAEWL